MIAILTDVSLTVVVICNSLMINHVEHLLFMCLLYVWIFFLENVCLAIVLIFKIGFFFFNIEYQLFDMSFFDSEYEK